MTTLAPGLSRTQVPALPRAKPSRWLVAVSVSFGTLMGAVDVSIINVALPHIRGAVGATVQEITWISTGYAVALVVVMPLTAFLGRLFGQKRVYMVCLGLFIAGSALCGLARSLTALVVYRVLQGLGAGALQPTEQAILRQTFPPKEQGMAMALFAMAVMLGPAIGPTLGGYIVDQWSWSWIFFINLPVGAIGLMMVWLFVLEDPAILEANRVVAERQRRHLDVAGIILLSVGLATLVYFLEEGAKKDWFDSSLITGCAATAGLCLTAFVARELTAKAPVVNLRLFADPVFTSGTLIGGVMFAMLMSNMFLMPIFMQELLGFSATQSGLALMPRTLVMMVAVPIVGRIYNKVSPRLLVGIGLFLVAFGSYDMSHLTLASGAGDVIYSISIQGVGFAFLFVPLTTVALSSIPRHKMPDATGLNSLVRQVGGAVGLAVFATLLDSYAVVARSALAAHIRPENPRVLERLHATAQALEARGLDTVQANDRAFHALFGSVARQAALLSFEQVFLLSGLLFVAVIPLLAFLKTPPDTTPPTGGH